MERAKEVFFKGLLKSDFISDIMVKNRVNIVLICIRAGGHSKPELRLEIIHYTLVAVVAGTMALVKDYYIKLILGELLVYLWFRHHLHSREQKVSIHFAAGPGN